MENDRPEHLHSNCIECGHAIEYGRQDKKFCSVDCKNRYNNKKNCDVRSIHSRIRGILDKNYKVLDKLVKLNVTAMDLGDIVQWGFNPEYATSFRKVRRHNEYRCFEIKYYISATRIYNIERNKVGR